MTIFKKVISPVFSWTDSSICDKNCKSSPKFVTKAVAPPYMVLLLSIYWKKNLFITHLSSHLRILSQTSSKVFYIAFEFYSKTIVQCIRKKREPCGHHHWLVFTIVVVSLSYIYIFFFCNEPNFASLINKYILTRFSVDASQFITRAYQTDLLKITPKFGFIYLLLFTRDSLFNSVKLL